MSTTVSPSRRTALQQLKRVANDDAYVARLDADGDDRARRQARELVAGVTRQRRWLDFILADFYNGDYDAMEDRLKHVLRLGLYELLMQETPTHAAVDQYVELAKSTVRSGAGGLVNGILRAVARADDLPAPRTGDVAEDLAIRYSHPSWLVQRWVERFGSEETEDLLQYNNKRPTYGLRVNPRTTSTGAVLSFLDDHDVPAMPSPYFNDVLRVERLQPVIQSGWLEDGRVAVQDESAVGVVALLEPRPGETIIDTCAAPGGKAVGAALAMTGRGTVHAIDVHERRLELVAESAAAHGMGEVVQTHAADLRTLAASDDAPMGDRVLVDAPCSGLGVLSKRADLRWQRTPEEMEELTSLQDELLDAAAQLVRPGGMLVYSTCTIAPEENADRVRAFLARHADFTLAPLPTAIPDALRTDDGFYATFPHRHGIDGAFGARLVRA